MLNLILIFILFICGNSFAGNFSDTSTSDTHIHVICSKYKPSEDGSRAFFGLEINQCYNSKSELGVYVVGHYDIHGSSPAKNKIPQGSRILSVRGCKINSTSELLEVFKGTAPGTAVEFKIKDSLLEKYVTINTFSYMPADFQRGSAKNKCDSIGLYSKQPKVLGEHK